jgi:DNA-binding FadR family transcriptional regulator
MDFHDVIFDIADNPRLTVILNNLRELVYRYRLEYVKDFDYHDTLVREHRQITDAIFNHDAEKARKIMKAHIYNQEITVIKTIQ